VFRIEDERMEDRFPARRRFITQSLTPCRPKSGGRKMSAAGCARIAAAARARWAKVRAAKGQSAAPAPSSNGAAPKKRTMSSAARAKIAAAQWARWAKVKAGK
jgi:hypothetical protein